ncbi:MAG TPA: cytochrome P460 family protein [Pseudolabrys sp.]|nr:cytochrome P460 family protein [Pseudolabrys sp.]
MKALMRFAMILAISQSAQAADTEAGKRLANTVCAACHGATGISVSDAVPNLAGQRARYVEAQLKFFKDGTRKEPGAVSRAAIMNAIASQLSVEEIANVAAYFESQPGAAPGTTSALLPNIATTKMAFPQDYKQSFTKYHTINFPAAKEVRYYYANTAALTAAKAGKPLPDGSILFAEVYSAKLDATNNPVTGADDFYVPDKLVRYTAMEREAGWGNDIPELLRNENWNYAIFTTAKQHQQGVNQAECLACHKPLSNVSYTFTLKQLSTAK